MDLKGSDNFKVGAKNIRDLKSSFVAMEYTGGYEYKFIQYCESKQINYTRIPGLAIKNSLGIVRGKNDKVDASRIAQYADEKHLSMKAAGPINTTIIELRQFLSFRKGLVRESAGYKASLNERAVMYKTNKNDLLTKIMVKKIKENDQMLKKVEDQMHQLIQSDETMLLNYKIISSIKGIGKVNALMTVAYTENFTSFKNARSYAVYTGVVPFDHSSGSSINKKRESVI